VDPLHADHLIDVDVVRTRADLEAFVRLPRELYSGNPDFVIPLDRDVFARLDRKRHPYFEHAEAELFLARRRGKVVGRIAATVNRLHNETHGEKCGFFGFFESVREFEVANALLERAAAWLRKRGQTSMRGPASFSSNDEFGLLVGGEPGPPTFMMPFNPPWYAPLIEGAGFHKVMDLYAWDMNQKDDVPRWERLAKRIADREGVTTRSMNMKTFARDVAIIREIYDDAWAENWGFVPMTAAEFAFMAKELRPIVVPELIHFVMKDGREIGFLLALPDLNEIIRTLNGRLFPFGFLKLLLRRKSVSRVRILAMGVRREFHGRGVDAMLYDAITRSSFALGIMQGELSWILETNAPMNNTLRRAGARIWRTYRVFERPL
jgi:GNAT superfamily N-acetyltransferase